METVISPALTPAGMDVLLGDIVGAFKTLCGRKPADDELEYLVRLAKQHKWSHQSLLMHILCFRDAQRRLQFPAIAKSGVMMEAKIHNGMTIFGPITDLFVTHSIQKKGTWEAEEEQAMQALVKPGSTVIDIGANIGYFTAIMAGLVGPQGKVWSVEMTPLLVKGIQKSIEFNKLKHVTILPYALGSKEETMVIGYNYVNFGGNALWPKNKEEVIDGVWNDDVQTKRLDDLLPANERIDFIKMDIEGSEGHAFLGMEKLLARCKPDILFEYTPTTLRTRGTPPEQVLGNLAKLGYKFGWAKDYCTKPDIRTAIRKSGRSADEILTETKDMKSFENLLALAKD